MGLTEKSVAAAPVFAEFGGRQDLLPAVALDWERDKPRGSGRFNHWACKQHADRASGSGEASYSMRRFDPNRPDA